MKSILRNPYLTSVQLFSIALFTSCSQGPLGVHNSSNHRIRMLAQHDAILSGAVDTLHLDTDIPEGQVEALLRQIGRLDEVDATSGPRAYRKGDWPALSENLFGDQAPAVDELNLRRAVVHTMMLRLQVQNARLGIDAAQGRLLQSHGAFDTTAFAEGNLSQAESRRPDGSTPGVSGLTETQTNTASVGIQQNFATGTLLEIRGDLTRTDQDPSVFTDGSWYSSDLSLEVTQNLGRGSNYEVNRAAIDVAKIETLQAHASLRQEMIDAATEAATTYWQLQASWDQMRIERKLLERTQDVINRLQPRLEHDLTTADLTQVMAELENRRGDLIQTAGRLRDTSDQLKRLMLDPEIPLAGESTLAPLDYPSIGDLQLDLPAAIRSGLVYRPELEVALLAIDDADIRREVADHTRLPLIELTAGITLHGFDTDAHQTAISHLGEAEDITANVGLRIERALQNREALGRLAEAQANHAQAILAYQQASYDVVLDIKMAIREVIVAYQLLGSTRSSRRSAAESLRVAENLLEDGTARETFTTQIDRVLSRQNQLSQSEIAESQAYARFMIALAQLDRAMGTTLERYGIESLANQQNDISENTNN